MRKDLAPKCKVFSIYYMFFSEWLKLQESTPNHTDPQMTTGWDRSSYIKEPDLNDREQVRNFMKAYETMSDEEKEQIPLATIINLMWKAKRYGLSKLPG